MRLGDGLRDGAGWDGTQRCVSGERQSRTAVAAAWAAALRLMYQRLQTTVAAWFVVSFFHAIVCDTCQRIDHGVGECTEPDECDCYNAKLQVQLVHRSTPRRNRLTLSIYVRRFVPAHLAPTTTGLEPAISRSTTLQYRNLHKPSVHVLSEDNKRLHRHRRSVEEVAWHATVDVDHGKLRSIVVLVGERMRGKPAIQKTRSPRILCAAPGACM